MLRGISRGVLLAALAAAAACGDTTTPTAPAPTIITETYSGTLIRASASTFSFTTLTGGAVVATLTALGPEVPDTTKQVGFSLGTFITATRTCTVIMDNLVATQSFAFNAQTSSIGTYCVRIYDNGTMTATDGPYTFTITVSHPQ
jgi:hypothetical protein